MAPWRWLSELGRRLQVLVRRKQFDREMDEEIRAHVASRERELRDAGLSSGAAYTEAHKQLGNALVMREASHDAWGWTWFEQLAQDLRYAFRMLRKSPGFTFVAVLTLALGIGANTAIFSVVNAVLLKPLPFPDAQRIVVLGGNASTFLGRFANFSEPVKSGKLTVDMAEKFFDPLRWQRHLRSFGALAAYHGGNVNLTDAGQPETVPAAQVTSEFFRVLGVEPIRGQDFRADAQGPSGGVILSWELWQRRYHSDPDIIGKIIVVNAQPITVIGVMPGAFQFPSNTEIWVPKGIGDDTIDRGVMFTDLIGRIRSDTSFAQAQAEMDAVTAQIRDAIPSVKKLGGPGIVLTRLQDSLTSNSRTTLLLLLGAVGCVLLIACANVANLVFCRGMNRLREVAVRAAMGAARPRLIRQLLTESLLLAVLGGLVGLLLAFWSLRSLIVFLPVAQPALMPIALDSHVLVFTALVSCGTGLLFGLAPALSATKLDLSNSLKDGLAIPGTQTHNRIRSSLLTTQVALSFVLLIGAGLMVRTLVCLLEVHPGFDAGDVLTLTISLPDAAYHSGSQITNYFDDVFARLKFLPGVQSAGAINYLPLGQSPYFGLLISTGSHPTSSSNPWDNYATFFTVSGDYFQAFHIPLLQGRYFSDQDGPQATRVAIVSESFARRFWPDQNAIGKQFRSDPKTYQVVGVVGNVHHASLEQPEELEMYLPEEQSPTSTMDLVIRTSGKPASIASYIREAILSVDKNQPIAGIQPMESVVNHSLASQWSHMLLLSIFGLLALGLAAIGCYAVVAYSVAQRTHEIGVRMALGANPRDIVRMVLGEGLRFAGIGIAIGVAGALALTRFLASLLFEIKPTDPATFISVAILLILVSLAACYIPARRAMKVDPMVALRYE